VNVLIGLAHLEENRNKDIQVHEYAFSIIKEATHDFSEYNILG